MIATGLAVAALGLLALIGGLLLLLPRRHRVNATLVVASTILCAYALEMLIPDAMTDPLRWRWIQAAERQGLPFDRRGRLEVVRDLRAEGVGASPVVAPVALLHEIGDEEADPQGRRLLPLAGLADSLTVACNEMGRWMTFRSDRFGFNNDDTVYDDPRHRVVVIGDSFAFGECVERSDNMVGQLRAAGVNAINLGYPGNGPLLELATLREYGLPLQPEIVLWVYFAGNDLRNLTQELQNPVLRRYLEPGFTQDLRARAEEIQALLRDFVAERERAALRRKYTGRLTLARLRALLRFAVQTVERRLGETEAATLDAFGEIIRQADAECRAAGARLVFVHVPSAETLHGGEDADRALVLARVAGQGIPIVDAEADLLALPDPTAALPWGQDGHLNALGYDVLAHAVATALVPDDQRVIRISR